MLFQCPEISGRPLCRRRFPPGRRIPIAPRWAGRDQTGNEPFDLTINAWASSHDIFSTGRSGPRNRLGLSPITALHSACVQGVSNIQNRRAIFTSCCGPSFSNRPASLFSEPILNAPAGIQRNLWRASSTVNPRNRPKPSCPHSPAQSGGTPAMSRRRSATKIDRRGVSCSRIPKPAKTGRGVETRRRRPWRRLRPLVN